MVLDIRRTCRLVLVLTLFGLLSGVLPAAPAAAATMYTVNATTDTGAGSGTTGDLRYAITQVNAGSGGDTINITATGTITLGSALPAINNNVTINGPGASNLTVQAAATPNTATYGVFAITSITTAYTVAISGLTIANGNVSGKGGGINGGVSTLTVTSCVISGNNATGSPGSPAGGGISVISGLLTLTNSTLSGNTAGGGGGLSVSNGTANVTNSTFVNNSSSTLGGGIANVGGTVRVTNSTFSNNSATNSVGGGIYNQTTLTVKNSTFSGNAASQGGGIFNNASATITTSIVAGNTFTIGGADVNNPITSGGHNLIGKTDGSSGWIGTDRTGRNTSPLNPLLGPLGSYTGPTQTFALLPGSPAIDAGDDTVCAALTGGNLDQRGKGRVGTCDIGAFESQGFAFSTPTGSGQSAVPGAAFANPLALTVTANTAGEPVVGGLVTFTGPASGAGILPVAIAATITAAGGASARVTANANAGTNYPVTATASGVPAAPATTFTLSNVPITFTPASPLPDGTVGTPYTATFVATGGTGGGFGYTLLTGTPPAGLTLAPTGVLSGTPTTQGSATFTVKATDSGGGTGSMAYSLTIAGAATTTSAANRSVTDSTGSQNVSLAATVTSTFGTVNTGTVTFTVMNGPTQLGNSVTSGTVTGGAASATYSLPGGTLPGTYSITATYNPGANYITSGDTAHTLTVTVGPTSRFALSGYPTPTTAGATQGFTVTAQDALGVTTPAYAGAVHFTSTDVQAIFASNDITLTNGTGSFSATLKAAGTQTITATDGGITGSQTGIQVTPGPAIAVAVVAGDGQSATAGSPFGTALQVKATDPYGNVVPGTSVTYTAPGSGASGTFAAPGSGATASATTDAQGIATAPVLTANVVAGSNLVTAGATGAPNVTFTLTNLAPTITLSPTSLPGGAGGVAYSEQLSASGGTTVTATFTTASTLPTGITLSSAGLLSGTPIQAGSFPITVTATDGNSFTGMQSYTLVITAPTITLSPTSLPGGTAGVAYSQQITASGGMAGYIFTVTTGALPTGLILDTTGLLHGTPTPAGPVTFTITATDANSFTGSQAYTLTLTAPTIALSPTTVPNAVAEQAYPSQTLTASGGTAPYTFAVTTGALPAGLALEPTTGVLGGTPTQAGSFSVTVTATDANTFTGSQSYAFTITAPTLTLSPTSLPNGVKGVAYPAQTITPGGVAPYTFTVIAGALPGGLMLDPTTGVLSGTPIATGANPFTVRAQDAHGFSGMQAYTVAITPILASISPASGSVAGGGRVTITGLGFGGVPANVRVTIGGAPAPVVSVTDTQLVVTAPAHGAGAADVVVTVGSATETLVGSYSYGAATALPGVQPTAVTGSNPAALPSPRATGGGSGNPSPLPGSRP